MAESIANGRVEDLRTYVSALVSRLRLGDNDRFTTYNGARDPVEVLGYRRGLGYRDYLQRYLRQDIAATIVKMYPEDTWSQGVQIKEAVRGEEDTPFEAEWKALEAFAKAGKAKSIGVSHYCRKHLDDILEIATIITDGGVISPIIYLHLSVMVQNAAHHAELRAVRLFPE
jgi:hypothetical protein